MALADGELQQVEVQLGWFVESFQCQVMRDRGEKATERLEDVLPRRSRWNLEIARVRGWLMVTEAPVQQL